MSYKFKFDKNHKKKLIKEKERIKLRKKIYNNAYNYWFCMDEYF